MWSCTCRTIFLSARPLHGRGTSSGLRSRVRPLTWCCGPARDFAPLAWVAESSWTWSMMAMHQRHPDQLSRCGTRARILHSPWHRHRNLVADRLPSPHLILPPRRPLRHDRYRPAPGSATSRTARQCNKPSPRQSNKSAPDSAPSPSKRGSATGRTSGGQQPTPHGAGELSEPTPPGRDVLPENEGPIGLRARRTRLPKEMDGTAFLVPFGSTTGAAAFQSGDSTYVVFDERRPVDMAALAADPVFASSSVQLLPTGTLLRIPHPAALSIALTQLQQGWRIAALANTPKQEPIVTSAADGHINLAAEQPSEVVNIADPDTGATLSGGHPAPPWPRSPIGPA